jgi:ATP-binding cassette subfamily B protein
VGVKPLLKDISFTLNRGEIIAFLGESGSGKSTLLQLLQRFYNPEKGEVLLNNTDWNKLYISDWRRLVGIVPQEIKLFNGTILENICLDNPKAQVDKVVAFIEKHQLQFFFAQFPQNILTLVGEQGINLSGGQRQMIALVRALYHQPQILLLDEFTSAMDKTLEEFAFMWIERLKTTLGIILITHQRNLAEKANNIYTLENGLLNRDCKLEPMF